MWVRRIRLGGVEYVIGDPRAPAPSGGRKLAPHELRRLLAAHRTHPSVRGLERELGGQRPERVRHESARASGPAPSTNLVCYELEAVAPRITPVVIHDYAPPQAMPLEPQPMFDEELHWVEIHLVGEDDVGIAGADCEVTLGTGKVVKRRTDHNGIVRIEGIVSTANCTVTFPRIDEAAWAPA